MQANDFVIINKFKDKPDHVNHAARIERVDLALGKVWVSNMNMPFMGTFAHQEFKLNEVTPVKQ